jgi:Ca2+-binding RTX toxin-like protein
MVAPTINIAFDKAALQIGQTATATFSFSAAPVGFTVDDVTATNGALSGFTATVDPLVYTALFTPSPGLNGATAQLSVAAGVYADSVGDLGMGGSSPAIAIDTRAPTVAVASSVSQLRSGETATITFTFSEAVTGFGPGDLSAVGGALSAFSATANPLVYTAVFTPDANLAGFLGSVSLAANTYTDIAGNNGGGGSSAAMTINTLGPSVSITSDTAVLKADGVALITFTFSAPPVGFTASDIIVTGGVLSGLTNMGSGVYEADFHPTSGVAAGFGNISVASGSYTDGANPGGGASAAPISIDTLRPAMTIAIGDPNLGIGQTTLVTFTFSEAVSGFTLADVTTMNGSLSGLATNDNITYTATLTPAAGVTDTTNVMTVDMTGVADGVGNAGVGTAESPNYVLDAVRPVATIVMADSSLRVGETSLVTFTFSEAVTGFTNADVSVPNGTLSAPSSSDGGITWTATFTPAAGVRDATNVIALNNGGYTDLAGNAGVGVTNSANFTLDTVRPDATIAVSKTALRIGETADVTITFTEAVTGFTNADLTVANGALSAVTSNDGGVTWTATLTPNAGVSDTSNLVTLDMTGVANSSGNTGSGTRNSTNYAIDTAPPTATISLANPAMQAGQTSQVTISFSEAVSGFSNADLTVENGALSGLASADGGRTWTGTFTPTAGAVDATNVITLDLTGVVDGSGNPGQGVATSGVYQVGYVPPQVSEDDVITLPAAGGVVSAGPGHDSVAGAGGDDVIQGNTGDDTLNGGGGHDIVRGGQGDDFVHGGAGADLLFGDLGDDSVFGGQGDDAVQGGRGDDYVLGDLGRDTVLGGQGADTVVGGAGDDYLSGDLGDDVLMGGAGADLFNFSGGGGRDVVMDFSHAEGDRIRISPSDAADFRALSARFADDSGNTVIDLGDQTVVLVGIAKSALTAADFVFS